MFLVFIWTALFCVVTVASIVLTGSRTLISGDLTFTRIIALLVDWHFILAAGFAFSARLFFILINNALLKIPQLATSSTTLTMLITSVAMVFVIIANYFVLGERITLSQGIGAGIILCGIFIITR